MALDLKQYLSSIKKDPAAIREAANKILSGEVSSLANNGVLQGWANTAIAQLNSYDERIAGKSSRLDNHGTDLAEKELDKAYSWITGAAQKHKADRMFSRSAGTAAEDAAKAANLESNAANLTDFSNFAGTPAERAALEARAAGMTSEAAKKNADLAAGGYATSGGTTKLASGDVIPTADLTRDQRMSAAAERQATIERNAGVATNVAGGSVSTPQNTAVPTAAQNAANAAVESGKGATATSGESYVIKSGDTLSALALANGTTVAELMRLNPQITNPNQIYAGKTLTLPGKAAAAGTGGGLSGILTAEAANAAINSDQDADIASKTTSDAPTTRRTVEDIMAEIEKSVAPETAAPSVPDTSASLEDRRAEYGVTDLESQVNDLQAQLAEVEANKRARVAAERGKAVATNVISGRIGEAERQENERIDALNRQLTAASNLLQTKYGIIDTLMKADATDYANASAAYDKQFAQNISLFNAAKGIEEADKSEEQRALDNARANAQILVNSMVSNGQTFDVLSPSQQATMTRLGVESGLGPDFFKMVAVSSANKEILTTINSDDDSTVSVIYKDGSQETFATGIRNRVASPSSSADKSAVTEADRAEIQNDIKAITGSDGYVSPSKMVKIRQNIAINTPGELSWFDAAFPPSLMLNPDINYTENKDFLSENKWTP